MTPKKRILIVEDEAIVATDLLEHLLRLGYEVAGIAHTAHDSLRLAGEYKPDLAIMDIEIIGPRDGIDAAAALRERFKLPVIFLSSHSDIETLDRAKTCEPYGYILKPFDPRELRAIIEMALYKHAAEQERAQLLADLEQALARVKKLSGLLPICCDCKKIRNDEGYWSEVEVYVRDHSDATFSHGFCPGCAQRMIEAIKFNRPDSPPAPR
jgi:two-component system, response regulator PdtaR